MGTTIPGKATEAEVDQVTKKKLMEDLKTVVNDAEELLKKAASAQTREWVETAQAKAKKSLKSANNWLAEEEETAIARTKSAVKVTEDYAQANTWMFLGMAATAGLVVGILAVRLGLSAIEGGKRLVNQGGRVIQDVGKRLKETIDES